MTTNGATAARGAKRTRTQRYGQTDIDAGMNTAVERGGGIVAGSHPEFEKTTPLEATLGAFNGFGKAWDAAMKKFKLGKSTQP